MCWMSPGPIQPCPEGGSSLTGGPGVKANSPSALTLVLLPCGVGRRGGGGRWQRKRQGNFGAWLFTAGALCSWASSSLSCRCVMCLVGTPASSQTLLLACHPGVNTSRPGCASCHSRVAVVVTLKNRNKYSFIVLFLTEGSFLASFISSQQFQ